MAVENRGGGKLDQLLKNHRYLIQSKSPAEIGRVIDIILQKTPELAKYPRHTIIQYALKNYSSKSKHLRI